MEKGNALTDSEIFSEIEKVISDDKGISKNIKDFFANIVTTVKISQQENYETGIRFFNYVCYEEVFEK